LRGLAKAIGVDAGQLSKESGRPGFPVDQTPDGPRYDAAAVLQWRQVNVRRKKSSRLEGASPPPTIPAEPPKIDRPSPPPAMAPGSAPAAAVTAASAPTAMPDPAPPRPRPRSHEDLSTDEDADLLAVLLSGKASALEITRATMQLVSRRVARAHLAWTLGPNDLDALKKSLQELRTAEAGYIDLEKSRHELIPRDDVRAIVAECCGRLVRVLGILENTIVMEFSVWLADPKVAAMGADERGRLIRGFISNTTRSARTEEADAIDRLINQPRE
jgi:hypothetical protein